MRIPFYCKDSEILSRVLFTIKNKIIDLSQAIKKEYGVMFKTNEKNL